MKDIYQAVNGNSKLLGTRTELARKLNVSRQCVHSAVDTGGKCKEYVISFHHKESTLTYASLKHRLAVASALLERSILTINDYNSELAKDGNYSHIGIAEDIVRFLEGRE